MGKEEKEALRYLGYRGSPAGEEVRRKIWYCLDELTKTCPGRSICRRFPVAFSDGSVTVGRLEIKSRDLSRHLAGCTEAYLFAATLGPQADLLLERYSKTDMSLAAVFQAAAAARMESYCDRQQEILAEAAAGQDLHLRPRYSPGYGDFSIRHQRGILQILDSTKRIGLSMTESFLLVPTKSVTAVIGITADKTSCHIGKCMECGAQNCPFRTEGTNESET
ncbi:hypothetical protein CAFE_37880 [Caprobacter fermentans]|uniref:Vitamin B12 dependent methionine synthase activation subunit n=1 Tax=Caproicibacter fermentans TaxID=2576756 RepID=A0A6N8I4Z6_9FIRM|nr:vitamin B12 dependent-methionine synthase activation domain-containing protein [Caproicibacter fermentans]MVB13035.1 hypothetical protein [Caproicibacter fermentans]OCN02435.1 hypothetical protein A7X67_15085 [Clostridium sp. W14A]QNK41298.1 Vitamin B12 dependent methionine synthase activation subunit [Caproicibacter fermentans]